MRLLFLVNDPGSPPGVLLEEAEKRGAESDLILAPKSTELKTRAPREMPQDSGTYDGIVIMGGVMSVNDEDEYPFIDKSRHLIRDFHAAGKPVMGVCLGAQLLASAFDAPVMKMRNGGEWGFVPQTWSRAAKEDRLLDDAEDHLALMEWHSDMFALPPHAVSLGSSKTCPQQAFRLGDATYGFQFHLELTRQTLENWIALRAKSVGKSVDEISADMGSVSEHLARQQVFARRVMNRWLYLCEERTAL